MADNAQWLQDLAKRTGATVESSDLDRLNSMDQEDDIARLKDAYSSQYVRRGASGQTGSGPEGSTMVGYGSGRDETMDDRVGGSGGGGSTVSAWNNSGGGSSGFGGGGGQDWYRDLMTRQQDFMEQQARANKERADGLYSTLSDRANQGLAINRNDPIIRGQADAYSANEERSKRNYLGDIAESSGQYANLRGEQRMANERVGQRTGAFEANLHAGELQAKRQEIAQALSGMAGILSADQQRELQLKLSMFDQAIKEQSVGLQARGQDINNDQFQRDLALRESFGWDDRNYRNIYG